MPRASICVRRAGKLYRLAWFNESKSGIYLGRFGSDRDHHHSYHRDGNRHHKAGAETWQPFQHASLDSFKGIAQLESSTQWLAPVWLKPVTEFAGAPPGELEITVSGDDPAGRELNLSIDWWLFEHPARVEMERVASSIGTMHPDAVDRAYREMPLDHYPDHSVAIVLATWPRTS
jgi:hypothetical protein